eukprot:CAMPEP_0170171962 /NCGR_PEP_ID=MMETSP0040_2-20121228/5170_1 /TAXON_ID=641309 /ORGANISM="Lotharella oceanica, Strain CCMP622" /LENGTH=147 /DNA_ID=CAMNT_0010412339 /DNA_START=36 /DNA_END=480 /DNA_ORIENTATION=-
MSSAQNEDEDPQLELQRKKVILGRQLIQLQGQLQMKERVKKSTELTIAEVKALPEKTNTYRTVGRMFLATPLPEVKDGLKKFLDETATEITQLEAKKKYLEKQAKSVMDEIKQSESTPAVAPEDETKRQLLDDVHELCIRAELAVLN